MDIFSDDNRRNPYPIYATVRQRSPIIKIPPPFDAWGIFDYEGVKRALSDHENFSNRVPAPRNWFIFFDPPRHTKLRAIISKAFTPRMISGLESRIRELSRTLLDQAMARHDGQIELASEYSIPLPMKVIAHMIGIPGSDWAQFKSWSDTILKMSYTRSGGVEAERAVADFVSVTAVMNDYLTSMIAKRRNLPSDDLLTRLIEAEVDGQHLTQDEILGFFQLLLVGGQETTTNLINNAIICFLDNPTQLKLLKTNMSLLPSAIEEVLRYRAPLQWMMRTPAREIEMHGQTLKPGQIILAMIGSANRDPKIFDKPETFDITRHPNPHIAFGHGIHFCLGSALAKMEANIALADVLTRLDNFQYATNQPWRPRQALHVHGPSKLHLVFDPQ